MNGLLTAIEKQGGLTALATALGTTKGVVFQWKLRGRVPPEYCPPIEKLTGVPCEQLNDCVDWSYLRNSCGDNPSATDRRHNPQSPQQKRETESVMTRQAAAAIEKEAQ